MRNPDRCLKMMAEMGKLWKDKYPDWRFGQLISNFANFVGRDIFFMEDDEFMEKFRKFVS